MEVVMIKDGQVLELRRLLNKGASLAASARMTVMDEKTARDYRDDTRLPSQRKSPRDYRTRVDPFEQVWDEVQARLEAEPRLQAKTLFEWLQEKYSGQFPDSTRRTFERRVATWRSLKGPGKPVMFDQVHHPGRLAASDFTVMNDLRVTIAGHRFDHTLFHCVLTYSNVESVSLCFSESFEALSAGIQKAFWEFGGVPKRHRSDSLSAAVNNHSDQKTHTARYQALMDHYGSQPEKTNARQAHENGDVESINGHLKNRVDQAMLLRGSRDFLSRDDYVSFLEELMVKTNRHRQTRFVEEQEFLARLPDFRLDTDEILRGIRVAKSSTIRVRTNRYSVPSRLIGQQVDVKIAAESIEVTHQGVSIQHMPRLIGNGGASINYRHVIDSLVRKPGAFENYKYREELFPTSYFRMAYDQLLETHSQKVAVKNYLKLLELAAHESQDAVHEVLRLKIQSGESIDVAEIRLLVVKAAEIPLATNVDVEPPSLSEFDCLLDHPDMESPFYDHAQETSNPEEDLREKPSREDLAALTGDEPSADEARPHEAVDRTVSGTSPAELSGSVWPACGSSGARESNPLGIPFGADDAGVRSPANRSDQTLDDQLQTAVGQDVGVVRVAPSSARGDAADGIPSRRHVLGSSRKLADVRQAGFGKKSRLMCPLGATHSERSQLVIHNMQPVGATTLDCQARPQVAQDDQTTGPLRGPDHRRPGLRAAKPRRDGSPVHAVGRALRTRQRAVDEQSGIQQMGPNLQRRNDDGGSDRPHGPPQRDPGTQRPKLSRGNGERRQIWRTLKSPFGFLIPVFGRNSSCR
jgi:transposase